MECDTCSRDASSGKDFLCVSCARSSVYLARLEVARVLLEKENLSQEVNSIVEPINDEPTVLAAAAYNHSAWKNEVSIVQKTTLTRNIEQTRSHGDVLKQEIQDIKNEITQRKAKLAVRRQALETISTTIPTRVQAAVDASTEVVDKGTASVNNTNTRLTTTRAFFCREAAILLRLKLKKRIKDGVIKEHYSIAGMLLPDLRDINNVRCVDLTSALGSAAHLLTLVAFYLGVRLPAEITVPHRDYPLPTINTPANSYLGVKINFPGSGSINTASGSPFSSRHDIRTSHRPRPLFIGSDDRDEKVAQFAKRDPSAFNFFVEGITLLAYDVAWLSRSQGFTSGTTMWEDICNIGRNLYQLLLTSPQTPALTRIISERDARRRSSRGNSSDNDRSQPSSTPSSPGSATPTTAQLHVLGKLASSSHTATNPSSYLATPPNVDVLKSWRFSNYTLISDALKKHLIVEMHNAEWEVVQEEEWDDGGETFDKTETVFVKGGNATTTTVTATPVQSVQVADRTNTTSPAQAGRPATDARTTSDNDNINSDDIRDNNNDNDTGNQGDNDDIDTRTTDVNDSDSTSTRTTTQPGKGKGKSGWTKIRGR